MTGVQPVYTVREAAEVARVSEATIRRAHRSGALRFSYVSEHPVITHDALMAWVNAAPNERATA